MKNNSFLRAGKWWFVRVPGCCRVRDPVFCLFCHTFLGAGETGIAQSCSGAGGQIALASNRENGSNKSFELGYWIAIAQP